MKYLYTIVYLVCFLFHTNLNAQGNIMYGMQIIDGNNQAVSNLEVSALETSTFQKVTGKTDANGLVILELNNGIEWSLSVGEINKDITIKSLPFQAVEMKELYIYDLKAHKRKQQQDPNRTNDGYSEIIQQATSDTPFEQPNCMLQLTIKHPDGNKLSGVNVSLVDVKNKKQYKDVTDQNGLAIFVVPNKTNYEIDINSSLNFHFADFEDEFVDRSLEIEYAPTIVKEQTKGDTIIQTTGSSAKPSSDRALVRIKVNGGHHNGVKDTIFLRDIKTGVKYMTVTDNQSMAYFLVPTKNVYMIDFLYRKNVDVVNLMNSKQMTTGEKTVYYDPDPRLEFPERYIPTTRTLFLNAFNTFLAKQYEKPKDKPFALKFHTGRKLNANSKEALFKLTLAGSDKYCEGVRIPLNIAFVLDKSGSMYWQDRYLQLKKTLWDLGNILDDSDVVSIVLFNQVGTTVQHSKSKHLSGFELIIENYEPGGGTNIFAGIQKGYEEVMMDFDPEKANIILVLTDGYGTTPPKDITDFVSEKYDEGIQFSSIGLGYDYNQALLELIAEKGQGSFGHTDTTVALTDVFVKNVKDAFKFNAKNVQVDLTFNENLEFINLYGFPVKSVSENQVSFSISKVPSSMNHLAFLKFRIKKASPEIESQPIKVRVSYFDLVKNENVVYEEELQLNWTEESDTELLLDQEEQMLYAIAIMNQSLKVMAEAYEAKDNKLAMKHLKLGIKQVEEIYPDAKPSDVKELFEDLNRYVMMFEKIEKN